MNVQISSATGNGIYNAQCMHIILYPTFYVFIDNNTTDDISCSLTIDFDNDLPDVLIETLISPNNKKTTIWKGWVRLKFGLD